MQFTVFAYSRGTGAVTLGGGVEGGGSGAVKTPNSGHFRALWGIILTLTPRTVM